MIIGITKYFSKKPLFVYFRARVTECSQVPIYLSFLPIKQNIIISSQQQSMLTSQLLLTAGSVHNTILKAYISKAAVQ